MSAIVAASYVAGGGVSYSATVLADSPLLYWRLGDASGTTATDSSGNSRAGTYTNSPTLGSTGLLAGDPDTAVTFARASSQYATIAHAAWMDVTTLSLECWMKTSTTGVIQHLWDRHSSSVIIFQMRVTSGNVIQFIGTNSVGVTGAVNVCDGNAHHIVCTLTNGGSANIYVDGVLDVTSTSLSLGTSSPGLDLGISFEGTGGRINGFNGVLDDAAYYGTALSATRVAAHYAAR